MHVHFLGRHEIRVLVEQQHVLSYFITEVTCACLYLFLGVDWICELGDHQHVFYCFPTERVIIREGGLYIFHGSSLDHRTSRAAHVSQWLSCILDIHAFGLHTSDTFHDRT